MGGIMKKIRFSVLMSVYRNDKVDNVKIAIDSILNQTLKPNQYVIMVDGPINDDMKKLLLDYDKKENIIELHFRDENKGLGITLNEGLNFCKYEYVARMDADDQSLIERFQKQVDYLKKHPEVDVIGTFIDEYDENLICKISSRFVPEFHDDIKKKIKSRNPVNHVTVMYRKESVLKVNGYENYQFFEDYYLWAKMITAGAIFYNLQYSLVNVRSGYSMYERRGGKKYIKCILKFEKGLYKLNIINKIEYLNNVVKRIIVATIPNRLRGYLYKIVLRNK